MKSNPRHMLGKNQNGNVVIVVLGKKQEREMQQQCSNSKVMEEIELLGGIVTQKTNTTMTKKRNQNKMVSLATMCIACKHHQLFNCSS